MEYCILSAGVGSRFKPFSSFANKALVPFPLKPIISQIIDRIPKNSKINIATGYLGEDLKEILCEIHKDREIKFFENKNYLTTGMGDSLMEMIDSIESDFVILPNDGIYHDDFYNINTHADVLLGISDNFLNPDEYLNLSVSSSSFITSVKRGDIVFYDKSSKSDTQYIFTGYMYVKDKDLYKNYLTLYNQDEREIYFPLKDYLINKYNVSTKYFNWTDCGTYKKYKNELNKIVDYDFSKEEETLLIYPSQKVYKIFKDRNVAIKRIQKASFFPSAFPKCNKLPSDRGYSYNYTEGETLYDQPTKHKLKILLDFLKNNLWSLEKLEFDISSDSSLFYKDKTKKRLSLLGEKYNLNKIKYINSKPIINDFIIPPLDYDSFINKAFTSPIHGDLQYDNVLINKEDITLIDWRHEFGNSVKFGDIYYDLAKLLGGIILNYKRIKKGDFDASLSSDGKNIQFKYVKDIYAYDHQQILYSFHYSHGFDIDNTRKLLSLIYLNMAPLHEPPFDLLLLALSNITFWSNES